MNDVIECFKIEKIKLPDGKYNGILGGNIIEIITPKYSEVKLRLKYSVKCIRIKVIVTVIDDEISWEEGHLTVKEKFLELVDDDGNNTPHRNNQRVRHRSLIRKCNEMVFKSEEFDHDINCIFYKHSKYLINDLLNSRQNSKKEQSLIDNLNNLINIYNDLI